MSYKSFFILLVIVFFLFTVAVAKSKPTHVDVSYGPHKRNVLDFWKADGEGPRPLLVYLHVGGWTGGDKKSAKDPYYYLGKGISFASINYRYSTTDPLPAPVHDAARAIQFLRFKAKEWNIDKKSIVLSGGSAGACSAMWILLHDDLADPKAKDPVLRESTRVTAAVASSGQTSIDPKVIEVWLGANVLKHRMICRAVGEKKIKGVLDNYEKYRSLYAEFSPYNHLDKNDPPLYMSYPSNITLPCKGGQHGIHHGVFGIKMKEKADKVGHECHLLIRGVSKSKRYSSSHKFIMDKLLGAKSTQKGKRN